MEKNLETFGIRVADADFKDERKDAVESLKDWQSKDKSSRCFLCLLLNKVTVTKIMLILRMHAEIQV